MDLNLTVLAGRLATEPEMRRFDSGSSLMRLLVTTRTNEPRRRVDVIPVVWWDVTDEQVESLHFQAGDRVWVAGMIQRSFWNEENGRRSRLEVVAHDVQKGVTHDNDES